MYAKNTHLRGGTCGGSSLFTFSGTVASSGGSVIAACRGRNLGRIS